MAEAVVSGVVQSLCNLLIEQTTSFTTSFTGVYGKFERLREELVSIQGFLHTADSNHNQDPGIGVWVNDVREIAYDVDDVIDAFLRKVAYMEEEERSFKRYAHKTKKVLSCYKLNMKMENLFLKLKDISERRKRYDGITTQTINSSNGRYTNDMLLRRVYSHTMDDVTIGLKEQTNALVSKLLKVEDRLCVVSIYGMGGLGKTTLAKEVYNHRDVKIHFDCYAWTSISQKLSAGGVLKEILRKVSTLSSKDMGEMEEIELVGKLSAILNGKQYFVVLDDIWSTKDWDVIRPAFPNSKGSKIMFTTRNKEVADHADLWSWHYEPRSLTDEEAWELFCKKAFPLNVINSSCSLSRDMAKCGRDMVKKCGGLPLAIIVLGGLLASKRSLNEWLCVSKQIRVVGMGRGKDDVVLSILSLSYLQLPYHLKPLFLYLGLFPEDSNIPVKKLVRMWMAENLIKKQEGETIEEVGRQYLDELINRCLVQIGKLSLRGRRAKTCRLHDKMRDLCIDIGKKENFFEVIRQPNSNSASSSPSSKLRRCAIYMKDVGEPYIFPKHLTLCLRTVFFISNGSFQDCPSMVYKDFKLLKVLVFQGGLKVGNELCSVLNKLSNLRYLETTDANLMCDKLHQLRHLYVHGSQLSNINKMKKLLTLFYVLAGPWIIDLVKLTNLEKLGIVRLNEESMGLLTMAIGGGGLDKLRSLSIDGAGFSSDLLEALFANHHLQKLNLCGRIKNGKLPSHLPSNLIKLFLGYANLSEDPMPTLEKLQHLLCLRLWDSYRGKQIVCSANGFPKLQKLEIWFLKQLEVWTVEKGAMPFLTTCVIDNCKILKMVPQGFQFLPKLKELTIIRMPKSFEQRVKEGREDWETIKHIPSIILKENE